MSQIKTNFRNLVNNIPMDVSSQAGNTGLTFQVIIFKLAHTLPSIPNLLANGDQKISILTT